MIVNSLLCAQGNFDVDCYGLIIGFFSFLLAFLYAYYLLNKYNLNYRFIINLVIFSAIGHFIGAFAFYSFAITYGADSCFYFENATTNYQGFGYYFAFWILGYLKKYLIGESFLSAFLISGALALIGSVYYILTYKLLLDKISDGSRTYYIDKNQLFIPTLLLSCWPSYFFWSAAIIKDNFAFLAISLIFFVIAKGKMNMSSCITLLIGSLLGFMVRPYLFIIFIFSTIIYLVLNSPKKLSFKLMTLAVIFFITYLMSPILNDYGYMVHFSGNITDVTKFAVQQQKYMNIGSSISAPTNDPKLMLFFIPYLIFINLLFPLGIGASNLIGLVSSFENFYLLFWIIFFIKNRASWTALKNKYRIVSFFITYFLFGITCLSVMCTNFGLAMREKMMYVPALLICIFLTYAYQRILILKAQNN